MHRTLLTPGKLYARLAAEFRRMRPAHCGNCRMPMVVLTHRLHLDGPNWTVEPGGTMCEKCRPIIATIVEQAAEEYDLRDPISVPFLPPAGGPFQQHLRH